MLDHFAMQLWLWQSVLAISFSLLSPVLAWRSDGGPERATALVMCVLAIEGLALDLILEPLAHSPLFPFIYGLGDVLAFLALLAISLRANRFYPMAMASAELIAVVGHGIYIAHPVSGILSYGALTVGPTHFAILFLFCGIVSQLRRRQRGRVFPDWRRL